MPLSTAPIGSKSGEEDSQIQSFEDLAKQVDYPISINPIQMESRIIGILSKKGGQKDNDNEYIVTSFVGIIYHITRQNFKARYPLFF